MKIEFFTQMYKTNIRKNEKVNPFNCSNKFKLWNRKYQRAPRYVF